MLTRESTIAIFAALFAISFVSTLCVSLPTYAATFVVTSDAEVSEVQIGFEGRPDTPASQSRPADRLLAWDTTIARGTRPAPFVEVTWRGPDGQGRSVRHVVLHEDGAPRCIHAIRLDGIGEPVPSGVLPNGAPLVIESRCR